MSGATGRLPAGATAVIAAVIAVVVAVVLAAAGAAVLLDGDDQSPRGPVAGPDDERDAEDAPVPTTGPEPALDCPPATVEVRTADDLTAALSAAQAGTVIHLADGTYPGEFTATGAGTAEQPVWLCGGRSAVLDGGPVDGGYTLHLEDADHWRVLGLTVRGGQKGVMVDSSSHVVLEGLTITGTGDEAIHLRRASTDNVVRGNVVRGTGLRKPKFGEGVYVGTAESNWCDISACAPDRSDRNTISGNDIAGVTAEGIDVKEGTRAGLIADNVLSAADAEAVDSAVDIKGNDWVVRGNTVVAVPEDGIQVHEITDGSGDGNTFTGNTSRGPVPGYLVHIAGAGDGNRVGCDNKVSAGDSEVSNVPCVDVVAETAGAAG